MKNWNFQRRHLVIPYAIFLVAFVIVPLLVLVYYAFTGGDGKPTLDNLVNFFTNPNAIGTLAYSLAISGTTTIVSLLLAYPTAYILARSKWKMQSVLLMVIVMPMWINFTLRISALKEVLTFLEGNLSYYPFINSVIGMTYDFLPFMILPIYTNLMKLDESLLEAARDLGASPAKAFMKVALPLSIPGIVSGVMMVFLPSMTNYVVLDMLYNSTYIMGSLIGSYFNAYDWNSGSTIALVLLTIICILSVVANRYEDEDAGNRGGALL